MRLRPGTTVAIMLVGGFIAFLLDHLGLLSPLVQWVRGAGG